MSIANLKYALLLFVLGLSLGLGFGFSQHQNAVDAYLPADVCDEIEVTILYLHPLSELNGQGYATTQACYEENVPFVPDCTSVCTYAYGCQCRAECVQNSTEQNHACGGLDSTPTPTPTPTPLSTPTPTPVPTPTATPPHTPTPTPLPTPTPTPFPTFTPTPTPTPFPTFTPTPTPTPTPFSTPTPTPFSTPTPTPFPTPTPTLTSTPTSTPTPLVSVSPSVSPSPPIFVPLAPICLGIQMSPATPTVGQAAVFTCSRVTGVNVYQFRVRLPNATIVNLDPVVTDGTVHAQSSPFSLTQVGAYVAQCRPCLELNNDASCSEYESLQ